MGATTAIVLVPEPTPCVAVVEPYAEVVPYWKYTLVAVPFGSTVPFRVAEVVPTALADPVPAVGAVAARAETAAASAATATRSVARRRIPHRVSRARERPCKESGRLCRRRV